MAVLSKWKEVNNETGNIKRPATIALIGRSGALSTAHLYGPSRLGGPLCELNNSNPS
jgi:hypothetical protein